MFILSVRAPFTRIGARCLHLSRSSGYSKQVELGDDGLPKDYKLKTLKSGSRRLDTFVNRATGNSSS